MLDANSGTLAAQSGAMERLLDPSFFDVASPIVAFLLVILLPTCVGLWVIFRALKDR